MDTTDAERRHRLDARHLRALEVLATGGRHADAAEAAGVDRVTGTKWAKSRLGFQAERIRRREEWSSELADWDAQIDAAVGFGTHPLPQGAPDRLRCGSPGGRDLGADTAVVHDGFDSNRTNWCSRRMS